MSSCNDDKTPYQILEAKRRQNIEDNQRFLAMLKINSIRDELKRTTVPLMSSSKMSDERKVMKNSNTIRRSSRIRKNAVLLKIENTQSMKVKRLRKKNDKQQKPKLQLPDHMETRYQSSGKKVALHNTKVKYVGNIDESLLM